MPEPTPQPGASSQRCALLRSKWMFIHVEREANDPRQESGLCWCVHTQNCLGPDGQVANEENCQPGRACYEEL